MDNFQFLLTSDLQESRDISTLGFADEGAEIYVSALRFSDGGKSPIRK